MFRTSLQCSEKRAHLLSQRHILEKQDCAHVLGRDPSTGDTSSGSEDVDNGPII